MIESLEFFPASQLPPAALDNVYVLVLNPCDGWHLGQVTVVEDEGGTKPPYIYIRDEYFNHLEPYQFYVTWAVLPNSVSLSGQFENQRIRRY